jgi:acetyl-CoA carboxylase biotin carboxyl carrier protein
MANSPKSGMSVDTDLVRQLAELLGETGLSEIEVEDGERKIRVARQLVGQVAAVAAAAPAMPAPQAAAAAPAPVPEDLKSHPGAIKSPMVGTAYLTPEPGAAHFVNVGDTVAAGDTVLIVEAMKVMNPIVAPRTGKVTRICVANEQPVEFDEVLAIIE